MKTVSRITLILLLTSFLMLTSNFQTVKAEGYTDVMVSEAKSMIDSNPSLVVLDVRAQIEYDSGHIRNAKLIPVTELEERLEELNKTDEILVYCHSGARSRMASQILVDNGFLHVYNMLGGITAWIDADYPVYVKYSSLQEAINNAIEGDTLFVSSGTYYENIIVNKTVSLAGENRETTIVDGSGFGTVINATVDDISISSFTIRNGSGPSGTGIYSIGSNLAIHGNIIRGNGVNVLLHFSSNNRIYNNTITDAMGGIVLYYCSNNLIQSNTVAYIQNDAVNIYNGFNNTLLGNVITDNSGYAIYLSHSYNNTLTGNTIAKNSYIVIQIHTTGNNSIYHNNFVNNTGDVSVYDSLDTWDNGCEGNYWSDYNGTDTSTPPNGIGDTYLPWQGVDNYPLMNAYWNPTDINHDLKVDIKDIATAALAFGSQAGDPKWNPHADITGTTDLEPDDKVDIRDIALIAKNYGKTYQ